jgi:hypothetical protein
MASSERQLDQPQEYLLSEALQQGQLACQAGLPEVNFRLTSWVPVLLVCWVQHWFFLPQSPKVWLPARQPQALQVLQVQQKLLAVGLAQRPLERGERQHQQGYRTQLRTSQGHTASQEHTASQGHKKRQVRKRPASAFHT